jgi:hypothetical protein
MVARILRQVVSWRDKGSTTSVRPKISGRATKHEEGMKLILEVGLGRFESYRSDN